MVFLWYCNCLFFTSLNIQLDVKLKVFSENALLLMTKYFSLKNWRSKTMKFLQWLKTKLQLQVNYFSLFWGTIKRFLSNLEPPVIPYDNYERLTIKHSLDLIISEINCFPIINFMTLMHVLKFLRQYIIPDEKRNLMTLENVAICFAPCLMRSK